MDDSKEDILGQKIELLATSRENTHNLPPLDPITHQKVQDHAQDRGLKKIYANWFIWILIVQLSVMNLVFIIGLYYHYDRWLLGTYMAGTLAEVFGVVVVITKNLFPSKKN